MTKFKHPEAIMEIIQCAPKTARLTLTKYMEIMETIINDGTDALAVAYAQRNEAMGLVETMLHDLTEVTAGDSLVEQSNSSAMTAILKAQGKA